MVNDVSEQSASATSKATCDRRGEAVALRFADDFPTTSFVGVSEGRTSRGAVSGRMADTCGLEGRAQP